MPREIIEAATEFGVSIGFDHSDSVKLARVFDFCLEWQRNNPKPTEDQS